MTSIKKIIAIATALTCVSMIAGPALPSYAMTAEELQNQIETLTQQLADLQAQLTTLEGEAEVTVTAYEGIPAAFTFGINLKYGDKSDDVTYLQTILASDATVYPEGLVTGYFGPLTKAAVIKFQTKYAEEILASWGLTTGTGFVGSTTRAKLNSLLAAVEEEEEVKLPSEITNAIECVTAGYEWYGSACHAIEEVVEEEEEVVEEEEEVVEEEEEVVEEEEEEEEVAALTAALNSATPVAGSVPLNVDNILFTKLDFTAGDTNAVINSITITRTGLGSDSDFAAVTLYDGSTKIGSTRTSFSSDHQMKFNITAGYTVPAGETKTLDIKAKIDTQGTYNALGILGASDVVLATGEVTGTFPIYGSQMSGVNVTDIGTVTVDGEGVATLTKKIGTDNVTLAQFSLEANNKEDLDFQSIRLKNIGTAADNNVANLYLMKGSDVLAGPVSMVSDYITFVLDTAYLIKKSDKVTFKVVGDIEDGLNNTVEFILKYDTDLVCIGETYGYNAIVVRTDFDATGDGNTTLTTIEGAELNLNLVSSTFDTPDETKNVVFGTLELTASSEDTSITELIITIDETDGDGHITNNKDVDELELYDSSDGTTYSLTMTGGGDTNDNDEVWTCEDEIYLTQGVKRSLQIRGDLPADIGNGDQYNIAITVDATNVVAEGAVSGDTITQFSVSALTGKKVTVKSAALTILSSPMMTGTAVIDSTDVDLFKGTLKAGAASSISIERMRFEQQAAGKFDITNINRVVFYTSAGEEQVITSGNLTDGEADFDALSITVPAGSSVSFGVKADISHTLDAANLTLHLQLDTVTARGSDGDSISAKDERGVNIADYVAIGDSTTQFDISTPVANTYRYTYDGTGTNPQISTYVQTGRVINIQAQNFAAANKGTFTVTGVGTNYFEITSADGTAEADKTIGTGSIKVAAELLTAREVTLYGAGILKVSMPVSDADVSRARYALADTTTDWIGKIKVRAENEAVKIKDLTLTNATADDEDSVVVDGIKLYKEDKTTLIGSTSLLGTDIAFFDDINYTVNLGTEYIYIKADLKKIGVGADDTADSNDALQSKVTAIVAEGAETGVALVTGDLDGAVAAGEIVYDKDLNGTYDEAADTETSLTKEFTVSGTRISEVGLVSSYSTSSLSSSISGTGTYNVAILKVVTDTTANTDSEGTLLKTVMDNLRFHVTKHGTTMALSGMTIERIGGSVGAKALTDVGTVFNAGDPEGYATIDADSAAFLAADAKVDSGDTAYFLVKATISALDTGAGVVDWIMVDLDGLDDNDDTENINWTDGTTSFKMLRLDYTAVDGTKISESL